MQALHLGKSKMEAAKMDGLFQLGHNTSTKVNEHKFMFIGKGGVFAEECVLLDKPSMYTIKCNSASGELITITNVEYYRRIKNVPETVK